MPMLMDLPVMNAVQPMPAIYTTVARDPLEALRAQLDGQLITPTDAAYDDARKVFADANERFRDGNH